jgi:hypothetical protein
MSTEKPVYEFLATEDNLNYANELSKELELFRKDMHNLFWKNYNSLMDQKIIASEYCSTWKYISFNMRRLLTDYERSSISPAHSDPAKPRLSFNFFQATPETNFHLIYSVNWNKRSSEMNYDGPAMTRLKVKLASYKINIPNEWEFLLGNSYWRIFDAEFLKRIFKETDVFCQEIVDHNWNMFLDFRPEMEQINLEVADISQS